MSGHSKWSTIKRQKGVTDARRGQLFTKLAKEIIIAARQGGANPEFNSRLRLAIQKAKDHNMPLGNIERAIKRANNEGEKTLMELTFEGYGPGGVALLMEALTDNRNRALQEIRGTLARCNGSLGEAGCVSWLFELKGVIILGVSEANAEDVVLWAIDNGAEDVKIEREFIEIYTKPADLEAMRHALEDKEFPVTSAEVTLVPNTTVELEGDTAIQALKLIDRLEGLDDVQRVSSNADFSYETLEKFQFQS